MAAFRRGLVFESSVRLVRRWLMIAESNRVRVDWRAFRLAEVDDEEGLLGSWEKEIA